MLGRLYRNTEILPGVKGTVFELTEIELETPPYEKIVQNAVDESYRVHATKSVDPPPGFVDIRCGRYPNLRRPEEGDAVGIAFGVQPVSLLSPHFTDTVRKLCVRVEAFAIAVVMPVMNLVTDELPELDNEELRKEGYILRIEQVAVEDRVFLSRVKVDGKTLGSWVEIPLRIPIPMFKQLLETPILN